MTNVLPPVGSTVLTVLGCQGAYPTAGQPCSGFLVESAATRVLVDVGYGTYEPLLAAVGDPRSVDAVLVTHGHPDHCADLSPLLRARRMSDPPPPPLLVHAPAGALDRVLALDDVARTAGAVELVVVDDGDRLAVGAFTVTAARLPHHVPDLGYRLETAGATLAYTGDCGPDPAVVELARDADLFLVEATHLEPVEGEHRGYLTDVRTAAEEARSAGAGRTLLTHLWPGTERAAVLAVAAEVAGADAGVAVASPGARVVLGTHRGS